MAKTVENLFVYIATFSSLLPILLFGLYARRKPLPKTFFLIGAYSIIEFVINIFTVFISSSVYNSIYSSFTVIEYLLFAYCLFLLISNLLIKKFIILVSCSFTIFAVIYFSTAEYKVLDSIPIGVETIIILSHIFYYLYEQMVAPSQILIYNRYHFWIVCAFMIYLSGSFFIYIFANQVDQNTLNIYWMFTNVFTILKNVFFSISILVFRKRTRHGIDTNSYYLT